MHNCFIRCFLWNPAIGYQVFISNTNNYWKSIWPTQGIKTGSAIPCQSESENNSYKGVILTQLEPHHHLQCSVISRPDHFCRGVSLNWRYSRCILSLVNRTSSHLVCSVNKVYSLRNQELSLNKRAGSFNTTKSKFKMKDPGWKENRETMNAAKPSLAPEYSGALNSVYRHSLQLLQYP